MADPRDEHLKRLRQWRVPAQRDLSLGFLKAQFKREVERPYKQLHLIAAAWLRLLPADLAEHTRLDGLTRGVLRVTVDDSGRLYQLDRLLRESLQRQLASASGTPLRKVQLRVGASDPPAGDGPRITPA